MALLLGRPAVEVRITSFQLGAALDVICCFLHDESAGKVRKDVGALIPGPGPGRF